MRACLVLPTYNEAGTVEDVITRALAAHSSVDVLVVDDGSSDGTAEIVERISDANSRVGILRRSRKLGLGDAYRTGFRHALANGYDLLLEMDADLSHDPSDVARLIAASANADLVIGSRYIAGGRIENWSATRRWLSRWANRYVRVMMQLPLTDATSGFRCYRRGAVEAIDLDRVKAEGYSFQIEMAWRAMRRGQRLAEIPIAFADRRVGVSKMTLRIAAEALFDVARWGIFRRPAKVSASPAAGDPPSGLPPSAGTRSGR